MCFVKKCEQLFNALRLTPIKSVIYTALKKPDNAKNQQ